MTKPYRSDTPRAESRFAHVRMALLILLGLAFATRVVLYAMARPELTTGGAAGLRAFAVGLVFDLLAALWLVLPLMLYLAAVTERWYHRPVNRGLLRTGVFLGVAVATFVAAAEAFFFEEFTSRFNFVAVDYLIFPQEVITNIWQSYPLVTVLAAIAAVGAGALLVLRRPLARAFAVVTPPTRRARSLVTYLVALGGLTLTVRPSLARVSDDRELNEVALNGWYSWWMAFRGQDAPYEGLYATAPVDEQARRLRHLLAEPQLDTATLNDSTTARVIRASLPAATRRMNVVVVLEESLGSLLVGALHPRDTSLTPHFDSLITQGTLLSNAYSTGNRTIRALEATTSALPPLPGISIVRRPASRDLFTLPSVFRSLGYSTSFIYGGRALFDGMGTYMRNNAMERVIEQKDFPDTLFTTAWGVSDEFIFDRALTDFDSLNAAGTPFFSLILSVSNHKPYTYPRGRIPHDPDRHWRDYAVRYADYALGRFIRQAQDKAWFGNTLFVLMGDHGARVYGASEIPLPSYEIPILFFAPGVIPAGQRITTLTSALDLPSTILARLGMEYESKFFGRDAFTMPDSAGRALMTHNTKVALMRGDRVALLDLQRASALYRYDLSAKRLLRVPEPDSAGRELIRDAITYYSAADRLYRTGAYAFPRVDSARTKR